MTLPVPDANDAMRQPIPSKLDHCRTGSSQQVELDYESPMARALAQAEELRGLRSCIRVRTERPRHGRVRPDNIGRPVQHAHAFPRDHDAVGNHGWLIQNRRRQGRQVRVERPP